MRGRTKLFFEQQRILHFYVAPEHLILIAIKEFVTLQEIIHQNRANLGTGFELAISEK